MRARLLPYAAAALLVAIPSMAQQPLFDPDDFVDPLMRSRSLFLLRMAAGVLVNPTDHYRPVDGNAGFVLITNSLYAGQFQFNYKRAELIGEDATPVQRCGHCQDPTDFPTPPPGNATPVLPPPEPSDTLQVAFYRTSNGSSPTPITLRYRLSATRRKAHTVVTSVATGEVLERRSGHDQSVTFDADTHLRIARLEVWGTLYGTRTSRSGTLDDRAQNEFAYVLRPPGRAIGPVLFRPKLAIGAITGRDGGGLNLINPSLEAYWRHEKTKVNLHLIVSAEGTRSGAEGWRTNNQVAIFLDRTLFVKSFGRPRGSEASTGPAQAGPRG